MGLGVHEGEDKGWACMKERVSLAGQPSIFLEGGGEK